MIYTVTFNPCIDLKMNVDCAVLGRTNRAFREELSVGGKGINVSIVLKNLGVDSVILGFAAGFTGNEIVARLQKMDCRSDFVTFSDGYSRINFKLNSNDAESEFNGIGPEVPSQALNDFMSRIERLSASDMLVISGSVPKSLPPQIYSDIVRIASQKKVRCIVDASGKLLCETLPFHPFLIKPNHHELAEILGTGETCDKEVVISRAKILQQQGAQNVIVSMAGCGAVLVTSNGTAYECEAPHGEVKNSIGAGDSMVAGFISGILNKGFSLSEEDFMNAFRLGVSAGSATAFSEQLATKNQIMAICSGLQIRRVE